jgi:hypothetical protein
MDTKQHVIEELRTIASQIPDLEGLTVVGSHGDPAKPLEKVNDFDCIFILKKLDGRSYTAVKEVMDALATRLASPSLKVWTEYRIGPVKAHYDTAEEMGIMLHVILFDIESLANYQKVSPFIALDWLKFNAIYGKNLADIYHFGFPTKEDLLHAPRASFDYYDKMLNEKVYILLDVQVDGDNLKLNPTTFPYPKEQWGELYADILKKVILNSVIVFKKMNTVWSDDALIDAFSEIFPAFATEKESIKEIIKLKKRSRAGEDLSGSIEVYEQKTRALLAKIKNEIEKSH